MTNPIQLLSLRATATLAALALVLVSATAVLGQGEALEGKLRSGETITIGADESVDGDLYAFAGSVVVDGTVDGDLVASGGQITVNGVVVGDLIAAGGTITVAGTVAGDARVAGGQVTVSGDVGEDLVVAGGQVTLSASGSVGEDVIVTAGQLSLSGSVAGSIEGSAGTYQRTGEVGGAENVAVGEPDDGEDDDREDDDRGENPVLDALRHLVAVILFGALALWLAPARTREAAELVRRRPLASIGIGLLTLLGWIVALIAILIIVVVIALVLGLIGFGELAALVVIAGVLGSMLAGVALFVAVSYLADAIVALGLLGMARANARSWWIAIGMLALGAAIVVILTSLPVIGGFVKLVVVALGLGALALAGWTSWRMRRAGAGTDADAAALPADA